MNLLKTLKKIELFLYKNLLEFLGGLILVDIKLDIS